MRLIIEENILKKENIKDLKEIINDLIQKHEIIFFSNDPGDLITNFLHKYEIEYSEVANFKLKEIYKCDYLVTNNVNEISTYKNGNIIIIEKKLKKLKII